MHAKATWRTAVRVGLVAAVFAAAGAPARAFEWQVDVTPDGELFPALQLSQSPPVGRDGSGDGDGLVSIRLGGADLPSTVRLEIRTPGLRRPAVVEIEPPRGATTIALRPRFEWDVGAMRDLALPRRQTLAVTLAADGRSESRDVPVRVHPLDDAAYYVREGREHVDLGWAFAGYVDPDDAVIDAILDSARTLEAGLPLRDADPPIRSVAAVWAALERRGLQYDAGDPALGRGPVVWSQRVRLPAQVWSDRKASCIDGSVLIAAVLERLGMQPLIVLVPGHAFVGFREQGVGSRSEFFETTLLGAPRRGGAATRAALNFAAARRAGEAHWRRVATKLDGRHGPDYALIDIGRARSYGIIPLGAGERAARRQSDPVPAPAGSPRLRSLP